MHSVVRTEEKKKVEERDITVNLMDTKKQSDLPSRLLRARAFPFVSRARRSRPLRLAVLNNQPPSSPAAASRLPLCCSLRAAAEREGESPRRVPADTGGARAGRLSRSATKSSNICDCGVIFSTER